MRLTRLALGLSLLSACHGAPTKETAPAAELPRGAELVLPPDWRTSSPAAFESWVTSALPEELSTPIRKDGLRELQTALGEVTRPLPDGGVTPVAVRAAVILGRSRYPTSA